MNRKKNVYYVVSQSNSLFGTCLMYYPLILRRVVGCVCVWVVCVWLLPSQRSSLPRDASPDGAGGSLSYDTQDGG